MEDFGRTIKSKHLAGEYCRRMQYIADQFISHPRLPDWLRQGISNEWHSDVFVTDALHEKISKLTPYQREVIESLIDKVIEGEEIQAYEAINTQGV